MHLLYSTIGITIGHPLGTTPRGIPVLRPDIFGPTWGTVGPVTVSGTETQHMYKRDMDTDTVLLVAYSVSFLVTLRCVLTRRIFFIRTFLIGPANTNAHHLV